jgi:hypothetical protein
MYAYVYFYFIASYFTSLHSVTRSAATVFHQLDTNASACGLLNVKIKLLVLL